MKDKLNIKELLYEICEDERVFEDNINLVDSGLLDSYVFIELFARLEDYNIFLQPTRIDRSNLQTVAGIEELINDSEISRKN